MARKIYHMAIIRDPDDDLVFTLYIDDRPTAMRRLIKVDGISSVMRSGRDAVVVWCDPRYDRDEIIDELRLILAPPPDPVWYRGLSGVDLDPTKESQ